MVERIEKLEDDLNIIKYKLELLEQFYKSDAEKTDALSIFLNSIKEFMLNTDDRIKDLQDSYVTQTKNIELMNQIIDSQRRMINSIVNILENK